MKIKILYEGHWQVPKRNGKKDYSFLLHGKKDRERFLKKMQTHGKVK
jgi:hypothetical protein